MKLWPNALAALLALVIATPAHAFCGFYVAKADTRLYNRASKVVLARDGERTAITMAADYQGTPANFAMVVPVPTVVRREQVRVVEPALLERIDNYSAPRLVEYFDPDPCAPMPPPMMMAPAASAAQDVMVTGSRRASALGVKIEARYQVGDYDILILSAKQSDGLVTWLTQNGYRLPPGAAPVVGSYLKQNMKFFVAKVNLARHAASGAERLRPLQVDYASRKFMLPIRLGTVNAAGPQELFVFTLTKRGRVETTNYRTVKLPSDMDVPIFVKDEFPGFYRATFSRAAVREGNDAVFLEYAWNSGSCDPCSAEPLRPEEASRLGARWATTDEGGNDVFVTRLHVRYSRATFPEDLMLQETGDDSTFQGRYVLRHAFTGPAKCAEGRRYRDALVVRWDKEAAMLNHLTGWSMRDIRTKMRANGERVSDRDVGATSWWSSLLAAVGDTWSRWTA